MKLRAAFLMSVSIMLTLLCHTAAYADVICNAVKGTCNNLCVVSKACCTGCYNTEAGQNSCQNCSIAGCNAWWCTGPGQTTQSTESPCQRCAVPPAVLDQTLGIKSALGAFVVSVEPGSPASNAGLALCDLITTLNGTDLREYVEHQKFRSVIREAAMFSEALLGIWKYDVQSEAYSSTVTPLGVPAYFGAPEGLATRFAVLVVEVPEESRAAAAGIRPWDFIERINGEQTSEFRNVIELDQRVSQILASDGKLRLTLGRWKPLPSPPERNIQGVLRDVTFKIRKLAGH